MSERYRILAQATNGNVYMHTLDGKPAMYQDGTYICFINNYHNVTFEEMFKPSLEQIRREHKASAKWHKDHGDGVSGGYGYIRIKL